MTEQDYIVSKTGTFRTYVADFYGPGGVYDMGATESQIIAATTTYLDRCRTFDSGMSWGGGDSFDREHVRDILINQFDLKFPQPRKHG